MMEDEIFRGDEEVDGNDMSQPLLRGHSDTTREGPDRQGSKTDILAERLVLKKIDRTIIPLLFVTYMLNFMDKIILSSAAVFGLREDTVGLPYINKSSQSNSRGTEPPRPTVQLGRQHLLRRVPDLDLPYDHPHCPPSHWQVSDHQHHVLGHRCRSHGHVLQL